MRDKIKEKVHEFYWNLNINYTKTTLLCLSDLMNIPLNSQVLQSAIGLNGAGGYRAQCGLVEGSLMFIGIFFSQKDKSDPPHACEQLTRNSVEFTYNFIKSISAN